jgi:Vacuolar protein sorting protein 36 Vps36
MDQFVFPVDISQTKRPVLFLNETIRQVQQSVGLYFGCFVSKARDEKLAAFNDGLLYITTHRLIWINEKNNSGIAFSNSQIGHQIESQTGFITSSPKIILRISKAELDNEESKVSVGKEWNCGICNHLNRDSLRCTECGSEMISNPKDDIPKECSACTYLNLSNVSKCVICDSDLGPINESISAAPKPVASAIFKLSLRAGGHVECVNAIRAAIASKLWQVSNTPDSSPTYTVNRSLGGGVCMLF